MAASRWLEDAKGCRFLDPDPRFPARERIQWSGACVDRWVHGQGQVLLGLRKRAYSGTFVKGQRSCRARARDRASSGSPRSASSKGEFLDGLFHGRGRLRANSKGQGFAFEGASHGEIAKDPGVLIVGDTTIEG